MINTFVISYRDLQPLLSDNTPIEMDIGLRLVLDDPDSDITSTTFNGKDCKAIAVRDTNTGCRYVSILANDDIYNQSLRFDLVTGVTYTLWHFKPNIFVRIFRAISSYMRRPKL